MADTISRHATLFRHHESHDGTWGALVTEQESWLTLELRWRGNERNISCVPYGPYVMDWTKSEVFGRYTYQLLDVPDRAGIRFHPANYATELKGCIALGNGIWKGNGAWGVTHSGRSIEQMQEVLDRNALVCSVTWEEPFHYIADRSEWVTAVPAGVMADLRRHCKATNGMVLATDAGPEVGVA